MTQSCMPQTHASQPNAPDEPGSDWSTVSPWATFEATRVSRFSQRAGEDQHGIRYWGAEGSRETAMSQNPTVTGPNIQSRHQVPVRTVQRSEGLMMGPGSVSWLWADSDPSVDVFADLDLDALDVERETPDEMNWFDWVEFARDTDHNHRIPRFY